MSNAEDADTMVSEFLDDDSINPKPIEIVMTVKVRGESATSPTPPAVTTTGDRCLLG